MAKLQTIAQRWQLLAPHITVKRPFLSLGATPVVLLFHGCDGPQPFLLRYANAATELGVTAVIVDSYKPRGISAAMARATICTALRFQGAERAGDVLAAAWGVSQLAGIDASRMMLAGWSHGGWSIMDLMTMPLTSAGDAGLADPNPAAVAKLRGLFLAYPFCSPPARTVRLGWRRGAPVQALVGGADILTRPAPLARAIDRIRADGYNAKSEVLPGATHSFDDETQPFFSPYRFHAAAAERAMTVWREFLTERR